MDEVGFVGGWGASGLGFGEGGIWVGFEPLLMGFIVITNEFL